MAVCSPNNTTPEYQFAISRIKRLINIENETKEIQKKLITMSSAVLKTTKNPRTNETFPDFLARLKKKAALVIRLISEDHASLNSQFKNMNEIKGFMKSNDIKVSSSHSRNQLIDSILAVRNYAIKNLEIRYKRQNKAIILKDLVANNNEIPLEMLTQSNIDVHSIYRIGDVEYAKSLNLDTLPPLSLQDSGYKLVEEIVNDISNNKFSILDAATDEEVLLVEYRVSQITTRMIHAIDLLIQRILGRYIQDNAVLKAVNYTVGPSPLIALIQSEREKRGLISITDINFPAKKRYKLIPQEDFSVPYIRHKDLISGNILKSPIDISTQHTRIQSVGSVFKKITELNDEYEDSIFILKIRERNEHIYNTWLESQRKVISDGLISWNL